jgi:hypothetical protein
VVLDASIVFGLWLVCSPNTFGGGFEQIDAIVQE